jgi:hypothetical protein
MIEKYLNDSIAPARKYMEERMFNANLTDKYLENIRKAAAKVEKAKPAPELPSPDVPTDEPPAKSPATTSVDTRPRTRR